MTSAATAAELRFDPPGPGSWEIDAVHFPRPATRYWAEMHPEPFKRGFREFTRFYFLLFSYVLNPTALRGLKELDQTWLFHKLNAAREASASYIAADRNWLRSTRRSH